MEKISFSDALQKSKELLRSVDVDRSPGNELVLIHLFWRMLDVQMPNPILNDRWAVQVLEGCDVDLSMPFFINDE